VVAGASPKPSKKALKTVERGFTGLVSKEMMKHPAFWTCDDEAVELIGQHLYYFAPTNRRPSPYTTRRHVKAIIDIADDGTLAGVELIENMPPPPKTE
jgi:hypothetical protein